eukprot:TRINITY_DN62361_c0_g1_i1.p1 TRINITY_DN62361_c0_g1~~TRINITY_DN62361_c0_g1_i1.p1  ORF type:complete len:262 (+),score=31.55 TRINITY_DN62361_c0_g1_i1:703-1488(+)
MGGWDHQTSWHADATYPAAMARVLNMHLDMISYNSSLGIDWAYHANDNAFLNYGDAWFSQRTLVTRFEMNKTGTVEVVRKPAINFMAMLSLLGSDRHPVSWSLPQVSPATPSSRPFGLVASSSLGARQQEIALLAWSSNGTSECLHGCERQVSVNLTLPSSWTGQPWIRVYRLDQSHGNPGQLFMNLTGGQPKNKPYPSAAEFQELRRAAELPSYDCCLLYTSDAADEEDSVDLGGRRIIKKKRKDHSEWKIRCNINERIE